MRTDTLVRAFACVCSSHGQHKDVDDDPLSIFLQSDESRVSKLMALYKVRRQNYSFAHCH